MRKTTPPKKGTTGVASPRLVLKLPPSWLPRDDTVYDAVAYNPERKKRMELRFSLEWKIHGTRYLDVSLPWQATMSDLLHTPRAIGRAYLASYPSCANVFCLRGPERPSPSPAASQSTSGKTARGQTLHSTAEPAGSLPGRRRSCHPS